MKFWYENLTMFSIDYRMNVSFKVLKIYKKHPVEGSFFIDIFRNEQVRFI